jgi:hypothetical protein
MIDLSAQVESLDIKALHKPNEGETALLGQQSLQLLGADDHDGISAADGDALRSFPLRSPHHLAEPGLGVLQLPSSVSLDGVEGASALCPALHSTFPA